MQFFALPISLLTAICAVAADSSFGTVDHGFFSAQGNEPGWSLQITDTTLRLSLDYGARTIDARRSKAITTDGTTSYRIPDEDLTISIKDQLCRDSMSGMVYPAMVEIQEGGRTLSGCGGEPRALLEGAAWGVDSLQDESLPDDIKISIQFLENARVAGSSGCNRFMGGYELTGEGLSFGQLGGTMMACPEPQMQIEQQFLKLMAEITGFDITEDGALVLTTSDGPQLSARR